MVGIMHESPHIHHVTKACVFFCGTEQPNAPVTMESGQVTLAPGLTCTIPLNVVDQGTSSGFYDFDLTISLSLR